MIDGFCHRPRREGKVALRSRYHPRPSREKHGSFALLPLALSKRWVVGLFDHGTPAFSALSVGNYKVVTGDDIGIVNFGPRSVVGFAN